jgi:hypothetical protein
MLSVRVLRLYAVKTETIQYVSLPESLTGHVARGEHDLVDPREFVTLP